MGRGGAVDVGVERASCVAVRSFPFASSRALPREVHDLSELAWPHVVAMLALCLSAVTAFAPTHVLPRRVTMRPTLTSISMVDSDLQSKLDDIEILKAKLAELDAAKSAAAAPVVPPPVVETPPPPAFEAPPPAFEPPALDTISQAAPVTAAAA